MVEKMVELRDIPGFEGLYATTKDGRIWSHRTQKFLSTCGVPDNYQVVNLSKNKKSKTYFVHRLVAMAWIPNPDNLPLVNHIDEHKDHNWSENLEWCTCKYNHDYSAVSKSRSVPVYCIELEKAFDSIHQAARELGISAANLSACLKHNTPMTCGGYHWKYYKE